jgi:hypothetical protein
MGIASLLEQRREYDGFACNYPGQWKSRRGQKNTRAMNTLYPTSGSCHETIPSSQANPLLAVATIRRNLVAHEVASSGYDKGPEKAL